MRHQVVYDTNIDYESSYERLCGLFPGVDKMPKGAIRFRLSAYGIMVLISPKGKVEVAWQDSGEKELGLELLKKSLVPAEGQNEVIFTPCHQNILKIPFPGPERIDLLWCKKKVQYIRDRVDRWVILVAILAFLLFLFYGTAYVDPSLRLLNQTIIAPLWTFPSFGLFPLMVTIFCLALIAWHRKEQ